MKKTIVYSIILLLLTVHAATAQKHEVRAVWLATIGGIDWPRTHTVTAQKQELTDMLDRLQQAGINTVLLQTRIRATTIYPSAIEPYDLCLTGHHGQAPGYDPLRFAIDECHRRGMELHAWMVTLPVGKTHEPRFKEFARKNPSLAMTIGQDGYMNPEVPATGDYLARICAEVTRLYDIDGVHLDYIRYPENWSRRATTPRRAATKVRRGGSGAVRTSTGTTAAQRRANITSIVDKVYRAVKREKPWVKVSCSPVGKHGDLSRYRSGGWNAYTAVNQDAQGWLRAGLMDQLYPMMYFRDNQFFPFALDWQEQSAGHTVAAGLGIYFLHPSEGRWVLSDVTRQLNVLRHEGMGHCFFRAKFLTDNTRGIYDYVCLFNRQPALVPPLAWAGKEAPAPPSSLRLEEGRLSWREAQNSNDSPYLVYNIYASRDYPVDVSRAENLVGTHFRGSALSVKPGYYYAVCAQDRYGQESQPCQMSGVVVPREDRPHVMLTDGKWLSLPQKGPALDAVRINVETLQGQVVMSRPYRGERISIARLPEGVYVLRSVGRKGVTHRLGHFAVKRRK